MCWWVIIRIAIHKLRHGEGMDGRVQLHKHSRLVWNSDAQHTLPALSDRRPLRYKAQSVEIHIRSADNGHESLSRVEQIVLVDIRLERGNRECTCRFGDGAGVFKDVFDSCADSVVVDELDVIYELLADAEGFFADYPNGRTITKHTNIVEHHSMTSFDGPGQGIAVESLSTHHLDIFGGYALDILAHTANQTTTADAAKDRVNVGHVNLAGEFDGSSTLAGDDVRMVIRRDVGEVEVVREPETFGFCIIKRVAVEDDLGAKPVDVLPLDGWSVFGHEDGAGDIKV